MQGPGQLSVMGIVLGTVDVVLGTVDVVLATVDVVLATANVVLGTVDASRTSQPQVQDSPGEVDYTKPLVREAMPVLGTPGELGIASGEPQPWCSRTEP